MVGKEDGKYFALSTINANNSNQNKCVDKVLYCSYYTVTLKFYLNDTEKANSSFKLEDAEVVLFKVNSDYNEKDAVTITSSSVKTHNVNISKEKQSTSLAPPSIVTDGKPNNVVSKAESRVSNIRKNKDYTKPSTTLVTTSVSGNNLTILEVEDHKIKFSKDKLNYDIKLNKATNKSRVS